MFNFVEQKLELLYARTTVSMKVLKTCGLLQKWYMSKFWQTNFLGAGGWSPPTARNLHWSKDGGGEEGRRKKKKERGKWDESREEPP